MTRPEKSYEKYAWIPLFIVGGITLIVGFSDLVGASAVVPVAYESITGLKWSALVNVQPIAANLFLFYNQVLGAFVIFLGGRSLQQFH